LYSFKNLNRYIYYLHGREGNSCPDIDIETLSQLLSGLAAVQFPFRKYQRRFGQSFQEECYDGDVGHQVWRGFDPVGDDGRVDSRPEFAIYGNADTLFWIPQSPFNPEPNSYLDNYHGRVVCPGKPYFDGDRRDNEVAASFATPMPAYRFNCLEEYEQITSATTSELWTPHQAWVGWANVLPLNRQQICGLAGGEEISIPEQQQGWNYPNLYATFRTPAGLLVTKRMMRLIYEDITVSMIGDASSSHPKMRRCYERGEATGEGCSTNNRGITPTIPVYQTLEDCQQACWEEGACCEIDGTCNIKPQCECDTDNGAVFAGVGEGCEAACGCPCGSNKSTGFFGDITSGSIAWQDASFPISDDCKTAIEAFILGKDGFYTFSYNHFDKTYYLAADKPNHYSGAITPEGEGCVLINAGLGSPRNESVSCSDSETEFVQSAGVTFPTPVSKDDCGFWVNGETRSFSTTQFIYIKNENVGQYPINLGIYRNPLP
jgi:hypothetical protein